MIKSILVILSFSIILGCSLNNLNNSKEQLILIRDTERALISGLTTPLVDFVINRDDEEYINVENYPLIINNGTYAISISLLSGAKYQFESFTIKDGDEINYILDKNSTINIEGFSISTDGVLSTTPKVILLKVVGIVFDPLEYEVISLDIPSEEILTIDPPELTFKISSNVPNATFTIYKYTIYWVNSGVFEQNSIFDMDTGNMFNPLIDGDGESWGSGKFKIETKNSYGEVVFLEGLSDDWSKKHIHLVLN